MNDEIRFECFLALSIAVFSTSKELMNTMKEVGLDVNPKGERDDSSINTGLMEISS